LSGCATVFYRSFGGGIRRPRLAHNKPPAVGRPTPRQRAPSLAAWDAAALTG
jgi:hypothetical protein